MMALVILEGSDDYLFVETGPNGEVAHYAPSLVAGDKQHTVYVISLLIHYNYGRLY